MNLKELGERMCACADLVLLASRHHLPIRTEHREAIAREGRSLGWKTIRGRGGRRQQLEQAVTKESSEVHMRGPTEDDIERCALWVDHVRAEKVQPDEFPGWLEGHLTAYADDKREEVLKRIHAAYDAVGYALRLSEKEYLGRRKDLGAEALACTLGIERESVDRYLNLERPETYVSTSLNELNELKKATLKLEH